MAWPTLNVAAPSATPGTYQQRLSRENAAFSFYTLGAAIGFETTSSLQAAGESHPSRKMRNLHGRRTLCRDQSDLFIE
jgi:hypothetical protein